MALNMTVPKKNGTSGYTFHHCVIDHWVVTSVVAVFIAVCLTDRKFLPYNPEAAYLYYSYHYNPEIKAEGNTRKEIKINPCIIKAACAVQKKLQWIIAQKGIVIETNPSSNALIGTFKRYDKHPILNCYNHGLEEKERGDVPQIQVSINTDDQGVFATYIENEYAYLALALEKVKDENGNPRYIRTLIYNWLDNIRKMGLVQSFEEVLED